MLNGRRKKPKGRSLAADVLLGAAAGTAAMLAMDRVTTLMYEREPRRAREREDAAREGKTAYGVAAEKAAAAAGHQLTEEKRASYGTAIHRAIGIGSGAVYAGLRRRIPAVGKGAGALFGTALWLTTDELATSALRLTPGPRAFPWQTHARGLVGHLVFGLVVDAALESVDRLVS